MNEKHAVKLLSAISHETRLGIVRYLVGCGEAGAPAGDIASKVGVSSSGASFHLSSLENAGALKSERQSRKIIYKADLQVLGEVVSYLLNDCCGNHPDILSCCIKTNC